MRAGPAAVLLCLMTCFTFPAAARIFWPNSGGDYLEGYRHYRDTCRNALQPPASCTDADGIFAGFILLQQSKVPDEKTAMQIAEAYIAAHPWPAVADGFHLKLRLEDRDNLTWHGIILAPDSKGAHALLDGKKNVPPVTGRPVGHIWVKPDGTAFYPVGYK